MLKELSVPHFKIISSISTLFSDISSFVSSPVFELMDKGWVSECKERERHFYVELFTEFTLV